MNARDTVNAVRELQHNYDTLLDVLNLIELPQEELARQNVTLKEFVSTVTFIAKNYDTPEIGPACRNHVELIERLNQALDLLGLDITT